MSMTFLVMHFFCFLFVEYLCKMTLGSMSSEIKMEVIIIINEQTQEDVI